MRIRINALGREVELDMPDNMVIGNKWHEITSWAMAIWYMSGSPHQIGFKTTPETRTSELSQKDKDEFKAWLLREQKKDLPYGYTRGGSLPG